MQRFLVVTLIHIVFVLSSTQGHALDLRNQYIVILKDNNARSSSMASKFSRLYGIKTLRSYRYALNGFSAQIPPRAYQAISQHSSVLRIHKDRTLRVSRPRLRNPSGNSQQSAESTPIPSSQIVPTGVLRIGSKDSPTAKIDGVDQRVNVGVAIIDTGIAQHPDLNRVGGISFIGNQPSRYLDLNGHGTHVAGTVGALDNGSGVVGVAPGASLWAVRVLDRNGAGSLSDVIAGIDWVAENSDKIAVANMSLGSEGSADPEDPMRVAIKNAVARGVVFVVAAGNEKQDSGTSSPANFPEVITVSAIADSDGKSGGLGKATSNGTDDTFATFSNFGSVVDIAAPGVDIYSTWLLGKFKTISGTSMASPHVAGAVALRIAAYGRAKNAAEVEEIATQIKIASTPQNDPEGFSGDPDSSKEPLINVSGW